MGKIIVLDENTSNKIAAGEVIERPASVVKELVENSIDAGAGSIFIEIRNGGISYIKITDNGSGIDEDDMEIAFERHATSKIRSANDLDSITTLGFRGEARASIAAVSGIEVTSRIQKNAHGMYVKIQGGSVKEAKPVGCPVGTTFVVKDLFYNTPARFKFLKKDSTEAGYISDIISRIALAKPHISFRLINGNTTVLHTPGNNELLSAIFSIYGKETAKEVVEINYEDNRVKITGYAGKPEIARGNRNHQSVFINGRYVKSKIITSAIDESYKTFLMKNKYAFIVMNMEVNPLTVDVNVHPTKMEIRFSEEQEIFRSVYHALSNALLGKSLVRTAHIEQKDRSSFKFEGTGMSKDSYVQQNIGYGGKVFKEQSNVSNYEYYGENKIHDNAIKKSEEESGTPVKDLPGFESETVLKPADSVVSSLKERLEQGELTGRNKKPEEVPESIIKTEPLAPLNEKRPSSPETVKVEEGSMESFKDKDEKEVDEVKNKTGDFLPEAKIIGQAFSTYILLQHENELIMIDQHAAHERIMYEKLLRKFLNKESISQELISPVVIELTNQEIKFLEEENDFLESLGFNFENFGNNTIMLRSIPFVEYSGSIKDIFLEVLDYITNAVKGGYKKDSYLSIADEALYTIACKAAIKANKKLDDMEIKKLLEELTKIENPFTCPHGRPTIVKLKKYELEKMFKRIV